jgi:hypothetical protein
MERSATLDKILGWVRAAYPDGVPAADRLGLIAVLGDFVSGDQLSGITALMGKAPAGTATPEQIAKVAAKLVAGGWPLANPGESEGDDDGSVLGRAIGGVVNWLRAGYPEGVPARDFIPLVAILERRLTKREVKAVTKQLKANGLLSPDTDDIENAITAQIHETPTSADIERVTAHLQAKGWPVELS